MQLEGGWRQCYDKPRSVLFEGGLIVLFLAALVVLAQPTDTWRMGGGRAWTNPPGGAYCLPYKWSCLDNSVRVTRDSNGAIKREAARIEAKARRGDVRSMRAIGLMTLNGIGVRQDPQSGLGWLYEAAIRGDPVSMYFLGRAFERGVGVAPDPKLAAFWLSRAAEHGVRPGKPR